MSALTAGKAPIEYAGAASHAATESRNSAVSWAAVLAGAFVAGALTFVLVPLATGLGLTSVSAWPNTGVSAASFGIMTGIGLIVVQWIASGVGGFITGRLRTKWVNTHTHEVFFRDTAHGFLTWAVATVVGAMLVTSAASGLIGGGVKATASVTSGAAEGAGQAAAGVAQSGFGPNMGYSIDSLFRGTKPDAPKPDAPKLDAQGNSQATRGEAARILANAVRTGDMPSADKTYLAGEIAQRTGITEADAQKRIDDAMAQAKATETKARQAADDVRKATSMLSIFTALSLLIGAFISCVAAAYGGSLRDEHP